MSDAFGFAPPAAVLTIFRRCAGGKSGWPDSNRRLLRPKRSTLTRLSYTPMAHEV
jgi:hypothetical protein